MFCRFCGKEIPDGAKFCVGCGREVAAPDKSGENTQQAGNSQDNGQQTGDFQANGQQEGAFRGTGQQAGFQPDGAGYGQPAPQVWPGQAYPMKWYKFIIYFQLFANTVLMAIMGIILITGAQYEGMAEMVYFVCPALKAVDVIYGIVCIAAAVCSILVRQKLAHYKKGAPTFYIGFTAVVMASSLVYLFAAMAALATVSSEAVFSSSGDIVGTVMGTLIGMAIFIPLNYLYFKKRKELFVN